MSIQSTTSRNNYIGNGAANVYPYGFRVFLESDLLVTVRDTDGNETTLVVDTDYTVSGVGLIGGGNVTLVDNGQTWLDSGFLIDDYVLTIRRVRPLTQDTDFRNQGAFFPETHEDTFDKVVMICQQLQDSIDRSMKLPETIDPADFDATLPATLLSNPGSAIGINDDGTAFVPVLIAESITVPIPVTQGGTNSTVALQNNRFIVSSSGKIQEAAAISANRIIIADSNGLPTGAAAITQNRVIVGGTNGVPVQASAITANKVITSDTNGLPVHNPAGVSDTQLGYLLNFFNYKKPEISSMTTTTVTPRAGGNGSTSSVPVRFKDGELRTETVSSRMVFDITRNAILTSGTAQSGLRTSLSEANNTWYHIYAVKVSGSTTQWVAVGDTTSPVAANFATLDSAYGANGWEYLYTVKNGDNSGATGDLLACKQIGNKFVFVNSCSAGVAMPGLILKTANGTANTWTYASGTGNEQVPLNIVVGNIAHFHDGVSGADQRITISNSAASLNYAYFQGNASQTGFTVGCDIPLEAGLKSTYAGGGTGNHYLVLAGFIDGSL